MKKTAEEYLDEYIKQRNLSPHKLFGFSEMADFAEDFAAQEVAEKDLKIRDFLFNMHEVENDKVVFNLSDLLQFFPPPQP